MKDEGWGKKGSRSRVRGADKELGKKRGEVWQMEDEGSG